MSTTQLHQTTTSSPEQYVVGLTDFGPGRAKLFDNSADEYLKVHHRGPSQADDRYGYGGDAGAHCGMITQCFRSRESWSS